MASPRKPKGKSDKNPPRSALDSEQSLLRERERQLKSQIDALQRSINEAGPGGSAGYRLRTTMTDPRTGQQSAQAGKQPPPRRPRRRVVLRAEREAGRWHTLALLVAVIVVVIWAASRYL